MNWIIRKNYVFEGCLRVVDVKNGAFKQKIIANLNGWRLSWVVCVLLEGCTEDTDLFVDQIMIQRLVNSEEKVFLSELVHLDDLVPVVSDFIEPFALGQVNQGKNVFFEATSTETDWTVQEFVSDSGVWGDAFSHFFDVSIVLFTQNGDAVDWGDSLGQETVGGQFWELGWGIVCEDNLFLANVFVEVGQFWDVGVLHASQDDSVRFHQVIDSSTLSQKLWIASNSVFGFIALYWCSVYHTHNHFEGANWDGRFLHNDDVVSHFMLIVVIHDVPDTNFGVA